MNSVVITTIQPPTASVIAMLAKASSAGFRLFAIADQKTPDVTWPCHAQYVSVREQLAGPFELARLAPFNHYARKNIGYLIAMNAGGTVIFDTDDDNAPLDTWSERALTTTARLCPEKGWVNVYRFFTDKHVWPRGLPLMSARHDRATPALAHCANVVAPIQQGLADGSPDVDAVWRLLMERDIRFQNGDSVLLPEGAWCPFNSQSTWWFPAAYSLMYLPSFVSFRMTDIWRSFVAQRCVWALGYGVVFHGPEMFQDRNVHNLLRDFEQEVPGYIANEKIREVLEDTNLQTGFDAVGDNCFRCYESLVKAGFVPPQEMPLLESWLRDIQKHSAN